VGQEVRREEPLAYIHARSATDAASAEERLRRAIQIDREPPASIPPLIWKRVTAGDLGRA
jgi:thymidine phosphorylase